MNSFQRFLLRAFVVFCLVNLSGLWTVMLIQYRYLRQLENLQLLSAQLGTQSAARLPGKNSPTPSPLIAPVLLPSPKATVLPTPTPSPSVEPSPTPVPTPTTPKSVAASPAPIQEAVVFLGSGSSTDTSWVEVSGAALVLDPAAYGTIIDLQFEAALSIWGGEAQARLINKDSGSVIFSSTVSNNTSNAVWKVSPTFQPFSGRAQYMVQLRSTSNERAQLEGARLRIRYRPK